MEDFEKLLNDIGLNLDSFESKNGAQAALLDIIVSRGDEELVGMTTDLDMNQQGPGELPDPRLNRPRMKKNSYSDSSEGQSGGSGGQQNNNSEKDQRDEPLKDPSENNDDNDDTALNDSKNSNDTKNSENSENSAENKESEDSTETDSSESSTNEAENIEKGHTLNIDDPDSIDPAVEERKRRINRLNDLLNQVTNKITGNTNESLNLMEASSNDELQKIDLLKQRLQDASALTDDDFEALENEILNYANKYIKLSISSKEDKEKRLQKFKDEMNSSKTAEEIDAEDAENKRQEYQNLKASEKQRQQYNNRGRIALKGFDDFKKSLFRAISLQVVQDENEEDSWSAIARRNVDKRVLKKGINTNIYNKSVPTIDFYFDQSGSWNSADIKTGERAVKMIQDLERQKKLIINIYYFSNEITTDPYDPCLGGGTGAWGKIIANIQKTGAKNVVIMTDSDMEGWGDHSTKLKVPGCVWFLWKNGDRAPSLPTELTGKLGTREFTFKRGDI